MADRVPRLRLSPARVRVAPVRRARVRRARVRPARVRRLRLRTAGARQAPLRCAWSLAAGIALPALVVAGCGASSTLPAGKWGQLIACLQSSPHLNVNAAGTGTHPELQTNAITILDRSSGHVLAYIGDNQLGADDVTGTAGVDPGDIAGPIQYGFSSKADASQRQAIIGCLKRQYPYVTTPPGSLTTATGPAGSATTGTATVVQAGPTTGQSGCPSHLLVGPDTSCPFAANVYAAVRAAYRAFGSIPATVTAYSPVTKKRYRLTCDLPDSGAEVACVAGTAEVSFDASLLKVHRR